MRNIAITTAASTLLIASASADFAISGPGMKEAIYLTGNECRTYQGYLTEDGVNKPFTKLKLTAVEWQLSAGRSTDNQYSMNQWGRYHNRSQPGVTRATLTLSERYSVGGGTKRTFQTSDFSYHNFRHVNDVTKGTITFNPPLVFKNTVVNYTVNQNMVNHVDDNANGNSISYIWFHGESTSGSSRPTGSLDVDSVVASGSHPTLNWSITRNGGSLTNPPLIGGPGYAAKGNNGHGNNADGVDSSNPGNWVERGVVDPSNGYDDEN